MRAIQNAGRAARRGRASVKAQSARRFRAGIVLGHYPQATTWFPLNRVPPAPREAVPSIVNDDNQLPSIGRLPVARRVG